MKKIIVVLLAVITVSFSLNFYQINGINKETNDFCNKCDTNKLEELAVKYRANKEENIEKEVPCAQSDPGDYVEYSNKNYYPPTTFNRVTFFENLTQYSPANSVGSCGYVSLIQALSYYDTFYNPNIIPETYNQRNLLAKTEIEAKSTSPGVIRQSYNSLQYSSYYEFCNATAYNNLQSYLTVLSNIIKGTNNDGQHKDSKGNIVNNFVNSIGAWNYQSVLNLFYNNENTVKVNYYGNNSQAEYIDLIKETISSGNPIIVHIKKFDEEGEEIGYHSVVVYDYNEGGIYANFGWGSYANRYLLLGGDAGYTLIDCAATLDFSYLGHTHSDNYIFGDKSYCGCNISDELVFDSDIYANLPPKFYWMKNLYDSNETYNIQFMNSFTGEVFFTYEGAYNQIRLSINAWDLIMSNNDQEFLIVFQRNSLITNYNFVTSIGYKPSLFMQSITLSPADYNFPEEYCPEEKSFNILKDDYNINTSRLRCGYIEQEYIILSPRKENAGTAYINYELNNYVYRIDIVLCLWGEKEYLSFADSKAYLQYKDSSGNWVNVLDLLNDIRLSTDKLFPETYTVLFPEKTKEFRIYVTTSKIGNRNKGRICIGDLNIYLEGNR